MIIDTLLTRLIKINAKYLAWIPDSLYIRLRYYYFLKEWPNLKEPVYFSEKLQWLKLNDRRPEYTMMVDKFKVKEYVSEKIGKEYIIPTLGVWDNIEDINFDELPDKFVLKCTHDSGGLVICRGKKEFNLEQAKEKICKSLKNNYYISEREWPYKNVKPRIIAEKFMLDNESVDLTDYKFYCFEGEPKYCQVICNRSTDESIDFFDMNWKHEEFTGMQKPFKHKCKEKIDKPVNFEDMKKFAKILSKDIPFIRVDFYEINELLYFGELTFYPAAGNGMFYPNRFNKTIGDMICLSNLD